MRRPPPGCWSCGTVPDEEDLRLRAFLQPRSPGDGGPYTRLRCASCGVDTVVEPVTDGDPVLAPPEAAGVELPGVAMAFEGGRGREERRRARAWMDRHGAGLESLRWERRNTPQAAPEAPPPPPRPGKGGRTRSGGPSPPPAARPSFDLPRTPAEARAVLGVPEGASRKEIDAAYRKASRKCHPDLVAHLDEDFQRLAHEKFLRLKRAQEILSPPASNRGQGS